VKLYITVETTSRELEAKTLLACSAAAAGFDVVIGLEDMVRRLCRFSEPGIFYDKSLHSEYPELFKRLKKNGFLIAVNDEEGLVVDETRYINFGVGKGVVDTVDMIFTWGSCHHNLINKAIPEYSGAIIDAGNPRMDILGPDLRQIFDSRVREIKEKYGDFILINTRYGFANNVIGGEEWKRKIQRGELGDRIEYLLNYYDFDQILWDEFVKMTQLLSRRYPDKNIVLRPHPSESIERWQELLRGVPNVKIIREGNVHPWILASNLLIHNGCSTAIEALLLDVPCVSYRPVVSQECDVVLPNSISYNVYDMDSLYEFIDNPFSSDILDGKDEWVQSLKKYIHCISGKKSVETIVDGLLSLSKKQAEKYFFASVCEKFLGYCGHVSRVLRYNSRKILNKKKLNVDSKWISLDLEDFKNMVKQYEFYNDEFKSLKVTKAYYDCFRVRKI